MKLLVKINLVLLLLLATAVAAFSTIGWDLLRRNAREEVLHNARLLIDSATAVRQYTLERIYPLLLTQAKYEFRPEMVSAFSAIEVLKNFRTADPEYKQFMYREPALNPTNLADRAVEWEADLISQFRSGNLASPATGERETPGGRMLYVAKPIKATAGCMFCHDTPDKAPPTMVAIYGPSNGFGWKLNEIVAAQIVQVPVALAQSRAEHTFRVFLWLTGGIFVVVAVVLNGVLWQIFVRPVTRISALADRVSMGDADAPEFHVKSRDEIGSLAASLTRMRVSLAQAVKMLEG